MNATALIMAGGYGERFWPISRTDFPKQFVSLLPNGRSLFQETYKRMSLILGRASVFVVTNIEHQSTFKMGW
jgi:mannose-1-phosphate guanylyltransferase